MRWVLLAVPGFRGGADSGACIAGADSARGSLSPRATALDVGHCLSSLHVGRCEPRQHTQQRLGLVFLSVVVAVVRHTALVNSFVLQSYSRQPKAVRDVIALDTHGL